MMTRAVSSVTAAASACASPYGTCVTSPGSGRKRVLLAGLAGEREGAHGPAVEAALGGDHVGPPGQPADLEGALVGLGARVAEEDLAVAAEVLEQPFGEGDGRFGDEEVGDMAEGGDLAC